MLSPTASKTSEGLFHNLPRNSPEPHQPFTPDAFGTSLSFCSGTRRNLVYYLHRDPRNLIRHLHRNTPEPHQPISHLFRNPPEPHHLSAPEPSGTFVCYLNRNPRNLISHLTRNPITFLARNLPVPCLLSVPRLSGTWLTIYAETLRKLIRHPNPPEPFPELDLAAAPDRTRAFLGWRPH